MAGIPIIPTFDANKIMVQTMETNAAYSAMGDGVQYGSDGDSNSSDSDSSGELERKCKEPAAATKKRSCPLQLRAMSQKSKRIAGGKRKK